MAEYFLSFPRPRPDRLPVGRGNVASKIRFGADGTSPSPSLNDKLSKISGEQDKVLEKRLAEISLNIGEQSFNAYDLLDLLKGLSKDTYKPPTTRGGKIYDIVTGILTLGTAWDARHSRTFVSLDNIYKQFAAANYESQQSILNTYLELAKAGVVQVESGVKLTPLGEQILAKRQGLQNNIAQPVSDKAGTASVPMTSESPAALKTDIPAEKPVEKEILLDLDSDSLEKRQTLANAREMKRASEGTQGDNPFHKLKLRIAATRNHAREMLLMTFGIWGAGMGFGVINNAEIAKQQQTNIEIRQENELFKQTGKYPDRGYLRTETDTTFSSFFILSLTGLMLLNGLIVATMAAKAMAQLKKDIQDAQRMGKSLIQLNPEADVQNQRLVDFLKKRIDFDCQRFSEQFAKVYDTQPETRQLLDKVFGSRDQLPSANDIQSLFQYYAYKLVLKEQNVSGWEGSQPVGETEFYKKLSTLLRVGMDRGELFEFVKANGDKPFGQEFNDAFTDQAELLEGKLDDEIRSVRSLLARDMEIDDHLKLARKTLLRSSLSTVDRSAQSQEINKLIESFKSYQSKIHQTLEQATRSPNPINLDGFDDDSLDEMILRLKTALEVERVKDKIHDALDSTEKISEKSLKSNGGTLVDTALQELADGNMEQKKTKASN